MKFWAGTTFDRIDMCKCTVASAKGALPGGATITHIETWPSKGSCRGSGSSNDNE
jgi:hypothetical protein